MRSAAVARSTEAGYHDGMDYSIGDYLRKWRISAGKTQSDTAAHFGNVQTVVSGWERGRRPVKIGTLVRLAAFYAVTPTQLAEVLVELGKQADGGVCADG
jgi:transcriptional regulator with XRE-family HTH domain